MAAKAVCADTEHDYRKFDPASVVCRKCGHQRIVDVAELIKTLPPITYLPCPGPHYPTYVPWWTPNTTWPVITTGSSTSYPLSDDVVITSIT